MKWNEQHKRFKYTPFCTRSVCFALYMVLVFSASLLGLLFWSSIHTKNSTVFEADKAVSISSTVISLLDNATIANTAALNKHVSFFNRNHNSSQTWFIFIKKYNNNSENTRMYSTIVNLFKTNPNEWVVYIFFSFNLLTTSQVVYFRVCISYRI